MKYLGFVIIGVAFCWSAFADTTYRMKVSGMTCGSCAAKVTKSCLKIPGVKAVNFSEVSAEGSVAIISVEKGAAMSRELVQAQLDRMPDNHYSVVELAPANASELPAK